MIKSDTNMSDTRRRRHKSERSHASDDLSESFDELAITKDTGVIIFFKYLIVTLNNYS